MKTVTAVEAKYRFGALMKAADEAPVGITRRSRWPRYVLMSGELYDVLQQIARAHAEEKLLVTVESALARYLAGDDAVGGRLMRTGSAALGRRLKEFERGRWREGSTRARKCSSTRTRRARRAPSARPDPREGSSR